MASPTAAPPSSANTARSPLGPLAPLIEQARQWWASVPNATRIIAVGLTALVALCLAGAVMLATAPQYEDLFNNLDPHDTAAITQKLDDEHEKYEVSADETSVRVPAADKDRLRLEMTRDGLPTKSASVVDSDWLDKIGMSTTSDVQSEYIRRADESELSQTIAAMSEIASAAVHLSPGVDSPIVDEGTPASASIVVGLKPGMSLTSDQVRGIANLVAKSVAGLELKNVAIVDGDGNELWDGSNSDAGLGGSPSDRMTAEHQYADDLRKKIQTTLDTVLGARKALVNVQAELNFNQIHSVQTAFGKGAVLSNESTDEKYTGSSGAAGAGGIGGAAGTASNTASSIAATGAPSYPGGGGGDAGHSGTYENTDDKTNYSNDKTDTETVEAPGGVSKLDVAVLIDSAVPQATVDALRAAIDTQVGVAQGDPTRVVTVQSVPFSNADALAQQAMVRTAESQSRQEEIVKIAAVAGVAVLLLVIFLKSTRSGRSGGAGGVGALPDYAPGQLLDGDMAGLPRLEARELPEGLLDEPMSIEELLDEMPLAQAGQVARRGKAAVPEIEEQMDIKLESVRDMVKNHPQSVALLMKGWMSDELDAH